MADREGGFRTGEPEHRRRGFAQATYPARWQGAVEPLRAVGLGFAGTQRHRRVHRAGADGIDADTIRDAFARRGAGQRTDSGLGGGVGAEERQPHVRAHAGGGVDDHAAAAGAHVADLVFHGEKHAGQVHREQAVPGCLVHVGQRPGFEDSGVVERDVQPAELGGGRGDEPLDVSGR